MNRSQSFVVPVLLSAFLYAGCWGTSEEVMSQRDVPTPADVRLTGTYQVIGFQTDFYDSGLNYVGTLTEADYAQWDGQLQLSGSRLYMGFVLDGSFGEMRGAYSVTYTSGTDTGTLDVEMDGSVDIWDFTCVGTWLSTVSYGYDASAGLYFTDNNFWIKLSDATTAFP